MWFQNKGLEDDDEGEDDHPVELLEQTEVGTTSLEEASNSKIVSSKVSGLRSDIAKTLCQRVVTWIRPLSACRMRKVRKMKLKRRRIV